MCHPVWGADSDAQGHPGQGTATVAPSRTQAWRAGCATAFLQRTSNPVGGRATLQLAPARHLGHCGSHRKRTLRQTCSREDPENAICVQRLDDSLNSAIRTRYRILLRSSSMHKPRDPPLEVVIGSLWPDGLSKHHTHCHGLTKKTMARDPRPRLARGMHDDTREPARPSAPRPGR